jgi:hypothetical protein
MHKYLKFPLAVCLALVALFQIQISCRAQKLKKPDPLLVSQFNAQSTPSKDLYLLLNRQVQWDNPNQSGTNELGLPLRFELIDEQKTEQGLVTQRYRLFAEGAPENKVYQFESWLVNQEITADPHDVYVNAQGLLMVHKPRPEQEMNLKDTEGEFTISAATVSAEPVRYLLSSRDQRLQFFGTLVPHPVIQVDRGCSIEARIAQPNAAAVLIGIKGFPTETKIPVVLESELSSVTEIVHTDHEGNAVLVDQPFVAGAKRGTLKMTAEGPDCLPSVSLPWSAEAPVVPPTAQVSKKQ